MSGNDGNIQSPDMPMMVISDVFNAGAEMPAANVNNGIQITPPVLNRTGMESLGASGAVRD
jgi:hypothetical protein